MGDERGVVRAIDWREVFPGLRLLSAVRLALNFRSMLLAAVALVGTAAGWRIIGRLFVDTADPSPFAKAVDANSTWPWELWTLGLPARSLGSFTSLESWFTSSPLAFAWNEISTPFERMYAANAPFTQLMYWLSCALWSLLVWAFFGGAISRMAAVGIARNENLSWSQLAGFVRQRLGSYFVAPLFPILGTFLLAVVLALLGLLMRADWGVLAAAIVWPAALLIGFMMAFLLIGLFFSWPLMWGAISAEGTDAFGALSHAYAYTYQRPLAYLLYVFVAGVLGVLGWFLVALFADWIVILSTWGAAWGCGAERMAQIIDGVELSPPAAWGRTLILFWHHAIWTLALGFLFSYFWTASTAIYFLLRRQVDATELDEVYLGPSQESHALPPLKTGPDGLPQVVDEVGPTDAQ